MDSRFVKSSINLSLLLGALLTLYFLQYGIKDSLSIAAGVLFSIGNIYLLWKLIQEIITLEERKKSNIAGLMILKFIFLWGAFIAFTILDWVNPLHFAIGFTVLLLVFALKGFGRWIVDYFNLSTGKTTDK